jgi:FtsZ-interacting cell division protein ZipA
MDLVLIGIGILSIVGLVWMIMKGSFTRGHSGFAPLTAFHDFQPKDKQDAVEVIIEEKAGKERFSQTSQGPGAKGGNDLSAGLLKQQSEEGELSSEKTGDQRNVSDRREKGKQHESQ